MKTCAILISVYEYIMDRVLVLDTHIDHTSFKTGVLEILKTIRAGWKQEEITIKVGVHLVRTTFTSFTLFCAIKKTRYYATLGQKGSFTLHIWRHCQQVLIARSIWNQGLFKIVTSLPGHRIEKMHTDKEQGGYFWRDSSVFPIRFNY